MANFSGKEIRRVLELANIKNERVENFLKEHAIKENFGEEEETEEEEVEVAEEEPVEDEGKVEDAVQDLVNSLVDALNSNGEVDLHLATDENGEVEAELAGSGEEELPEELPEEEPLPAEEEEELPPAKRDEGGDKVAELVDTVQQLLNALKTEEEPPAKRDDMYYENVVNKIASKLMKNEKIRKVLEKKKPNIVEEIKKRVATKLTAEIKNRSKNANKKTAQ